jgi:hypothetical protein
MEAASATKKAQQAASGREFGWRRLAENEAAAAAAAATTAVAAALAQH